MALSSKQLVAVTVVIAVLACLGIWVGALVPLWGK